MVAKNRILKKWLFDDTGCNELFVLMITRLVPVFPFNLQNFAYGITDIRFSTYAIGSLIFMLPGTAMYTVGIAGLADKENRLLYIGIAVVLAVVVTIIGMILKKRYLKDDLEENKGIRSKKYGKKEKYLGGENSSDCFDYCINRKLLCISVRKTCDESGI